MNGDYYKLLPNWILNKEMELVLSNDIDSLASCAVLEKALGLQIKHYYDFNKLYSTQDSDINKKCWVDVAIKDGYAFDNHVSSLHCGDIYNDQIVNLNQMNYISNENYCDKYAGSTLLEVWSIYSIPLPETEDGMMILLAIDASYKGFFSYKFHEVQRHYLVDILGFEKLYKCVLRHTMDDFEDIIIKYNLNADIKVKDNRLSLNMRLSEVSKELGISIRLPDIDFYPKRSFTIINSDSESIPDDVFSLALPYKNRARFSKEK